jgi:tetratricopeptide (TPR) repeat protein
MLETIREFASERLAASGEADEVRRRHATFFLALAEEAEPHVHTDDVSWLERLEADHDNLRAALDTLQATGAVRELQRLAGALWRFWYLRSHLLEGRRRLEAAAAASADAIPARAKVLHGTAVMVLNVGDAAASRRWAEQALDLETTLGNRWGVAYATMMIGNSLAEAEGEERDLDGALTHHKEAARLFADIGDRHYELICRSNQAWITGDLGDPEAERRLHQENLAIAREIGNTGIEADALAQLSMFLRDDGALDEALDHISEAIRIDHRRRMDLGTATQLGRLGSILVRHGDARRAAVLVAASEALIEQLGADPGWWAHRRDQETLELARTAGVDAEELERALTEGRALSIHEAVRLALGE